MENKDIMVTVFCTTYNHEKYIRQCLDGFVMQKTNFKYEVIIHEDASTDHTADIIKECEKKYPEIIKPIYENENQYKKGIDYVEMFCLNNAKGKYIALCEGDDFWVDEYKLQKQFDSMEKNPSCKLCICKVRAVQETGERLEQTYPSIELNTGFYGRFELLEMICKEYSFQTSSYFLDKTTLSKYYKEKPSFLKVAPVGDWPILLYFSQFDIYYINDEMSCYRKNSVNSFSTIIHNEQSVKILSFYKGMADMMNEFDKYTHFKYHDFCKIFDFYHYHYYMLLQEKNYKEIFSNKLYKEFLKKETKKDQLAIRLSYYCPWLVKLLAER